MIVLGSVFAALAAALHVYIFVLESVRWAHPSTRKVFGVRSEQDAQTMKQLAFNQGFYNLFLAALTVIGLVVTVAGVTSIGIALMLAGTGTMLAAALVLVIGDPSKARAGVTQGAFPLLAVISLIVAALT